MNEGDVLIVGGGIGGLAASIALSNIGFQVKIVEIARDLDSSVQGVGIIQPNNALRALDAIGCAEACIEQGYPGSSWMKMYNTEGELMHELPGEQIPGSSMPPMNGITRPRLHRILTERATGCGVKIEYDQTIESLDDRGTHVDVTFADSTTATADIVVGADGIKSAVRKLILPPIEPSYVGQSSFRCSIPRDPEIDCIILQLSNEGTAGIVPLAEDLAYLWFNATWDRNRRPQDDELLPILHHYLAPFGGVAGRVRDKYINEDAKIVLRPEDYLIAPGPWHKGRIVLIGDAVHAVTPHLAQGAAQAIEDGVVLAEALDSSSSVEQAFQTYMDRRYERCKLIVEGSAQIGKWQQNPGSGKEELALRRRVLEAVVAPI